MNVSITLFSDMLAMAAQPKLPDCNSQNVVTP